MHEEETRRKNRSLFWASVHVRRESAGIVQFWRADTPRDMWGYGEAHVIWWPCPARHTRGEVTDTELTIGVDQWDLNYPDMTSSPVLTTEFDNRDFILIFLLYFHSTNRLDTLFSNSWYLGMSSLEKSPPHSRSCADWPCPSEIVGSWSKCNSSLPWRLQVSERGAHSHRLPTFSLTNIFFVGLCWHSMTYSFPDTSSLSSEHAPLSKRGLKNWTKYPHDPDSSRSARWLLPLVVSLFFP